MLSTTRRFCWRILLLLTAVLSCLPTSTLSISRGKRQDSSMSLEEEFSASLEHVKTLAARMDELGLPSARQKLGELLTDHLGLAAMRNTTDAPVNCFNITNRLWDGINRNDGLSIHEAVRCGVDISDIINDDKESPLTQAAMDGRDEALLALLRLGGKVDGRARGWTPLHNAVWKGRGSTLALLMAAGADPNAAIEEEMTTGLHLAGRYGHLCLAQRLVESGAEVNARTKDGVTPMEEAMKNRRLAVMGYLMSVGGRL